MWLVCVGAGLQVVVVVVVVLYRALEWSAVCSDRWSLLLSGHSDIGQVRYNVKLVSSLLTRKLQLNISNSSELGKFISPERKPGHSLFSVL